MKPAEDPTASPTPTEPTPAMALHLSLQLAGLALRLFLGNTLRRLHLTRGRS